MGGREREVWEERAGVGDRGDREGGGVGKRQVWEVSRERGVDIHGW